MDNYFTVICTFFLLYESKTGPVAQEAGMRLERNDAKSVRWVCSLKPEEWISAKELRT